MISAQNHRRPLNGNRPLIWMCFLLMISWGCGPAKKAVITEKTSKESKPTPSKSTDKPVAKMDTIIWKEIEAKEQKPSSEPTKPEPKVIHEEKPSKEEGKQYKLPLEATGLKNFKLVFFAPFSIENADSSETNESAIRFIQFYGGMQMALQEYESKANGLPIKFEIFDEQNKSKVEEILKANESDKPDCIIGPYEIESLKYTTEWAKENKVLTISPWISSSSIATENPYYLQIKAGLNTHFNVIGKHIRQHYSDDQVFIVSKTKDDSRTKQFIRESGVKCKEAIISEEELLSESALVLEEYFLKDKPVVFVLPLTLSKDENYIYHFLRRVASEKADRSVTIYGTYRWLDFKPEIVDYINALNVRICLSNILDIEHPDLRNFKLRYYEKFRELPRNDVFEGYDLMKFILFTINKFNPGIGTHMGLSEPKYFQTQFILEPISKDQVSNKIDYFENKFARVVELNGYKFKVLD